MSLAGYLDLRHTIDMSTYQDTLHTSDPYSCSGCVSEASSGTGSRAKPKQRRTAVGDGAHISWLVVVSAQPATRSQKTVSRAAARKRTSSERS